LPVSPINPATGWLAQDEPPPVDALNPDHDQSLYVFLCDHASNRLPRRLGRLGLDADALHAHIAWDIGASKLAYLVAQSLRAPLIRTAYSRLVIDCNRSLLSPDSIPVRSEQTDIPGNRGISECERAERADVFFKPYHRAITTLLDRRIAKRVPTAIVSLHSFTPVYAGEHRPWHAGVCYDRDRRLAASLREHLERDPTLIIGTNQPYRVTRKSDYSIPIHAEDRGLPSTLIEVRQDLISDRIGIADWAGRLAHALQSLRSDGMGDRECLAI
jgi:predicted N-formylglutamate amidohydrolase